MIYFTRESDTLQRIAARVFGDWSLFPLLKDSNPELRDVLGANWEDDLPVGLPINIPDVPTADQAHTIQAGDSWESLSLLYYGTEHFSHRIRAGNPDLVIYESTGRAIVILALADARTIARLRTI